MRTKFLTIYYVIFLTITGANEVLSYFRMLLLSLFCFSLYYHYNNDSQFLLFLFLKKFRFILKEIVFLKFFNGFKDNVLLKRTKGELYPHENKIWTMWNENNKNDNKYICKIKDPNIFVNHNTWIELQIHIYILIIYLFIYLINLLIEIKKIIIKMGANSD